MTKPVKCCAETIALAAWKVLNHDNDFFGTQDYNVANRKKLIGVIKKAMRASCHAPKESKNG